MLNSLKYKLIFFSFTSILITLVFVGIAFDFLLSSQYQQSARSEIEHSYEFINNHLKSFEKPILRQTQHLATDDSVITSVNLINRYQDQNNYQPLIFDTEKKKIAHYLLNQITSTRSEIASIYGKDGKLILFAVQNERHKIIGFTSYQNGEPFYLQQDSHSEKWLPSALHSRVSASTPISHDTQTTLSRGATIDYKSNNSDISIENIQPIRRTYPDGKSELIGYVKVIKPVGSDFLKTLSARTHTNFTLLLENGLILNEQRNLFPITNFRGSAQLMGSTMVSQPDWLEHSTYYIQHYVIPAINGKPHLFITLHKGELNTALNQSRYTLLLIFIFTATVVTAFGIYWLNHLVSQPLNTLIEHASKIEKGESSSFPLRDSDDEIGLLSHVLNTMASAVMEREEELRQSQHDLKDAQHIAKTGSWKRNYVTGELNWSDEVYNILNLTPGSSTPYPEAFIDHTHPDDKEFVQNTRSISREKQHSCDITYRIITDDNKTKFIHERCETHANENGHPIASSGTVQDVTEQNDRDERMRRTQRMDALGNLTGGIAHDFNNMLGVILGFSGLMKERVADDEKLRNYTTNIIHAGERARDLTSKLLAFSRMKPVAPETTDLNTILIAQKNMLEKSLTARIQLDLDLDEELWKISIERDSLEDAILNMSINAMHAMPEGGTLTLTTRNLHLHPADTSTLDIEAGDYILFSLVDTGEGMNNETLEKLFDPFFSTKGLNGTGLGMSQVYGFVSQSGGSIQVFSQLGHGTRFDIYFPRDTSGNVLRTLDNRNHDEVDLNGFETILIVDDEEGIRNFEQETLSSHGYRVLSAGSGNEALEILSANTVDLLVTDIIMPGMDGYQLASTVGSRYPTTKIILASGYTEKRNKELVSEELHGTMLKKPFTSSSLLLQIRESLDHSKKSPQNSGEIAWSDDFSTGCTAIDNDHKRLILLFQKCHEKLRSDTNKECVGNTLNELIDYTGSHFKREERLMEICEYPDISSHKDVHTKILAQLQEQIKKYGNNELSAESVLHFLTSWIINHIAVHDQKIAQSCVGKEKLIEKYLN